jgi:hypothetical protein
MAMAELLMEKTGDGTLLITAVGSHFFVFEKGGIHGC